MVEFQVLWTKINNYLVSLLISDHFCENLLQSCDLSPPLLSQKIYRQRDEDNSGTMSSTEMRSAVEEAGKTQTYHNKSTEVSSQQRHLTDHKVRGQMGFSTWLELIQAGRNLHHVTGSCVW